MSSEKFCLKWNDFERNISSAFRDIREEKEFFDMTLACEDEQLPAHKVILSACSPFFRTVLRRNPHQHPLLYLKGVSFRDLQAVLNFMYHGEVNVAQDDLNSFLQVAEDLKVKGLTQQNHSSSNNSTSRPATALSPPPRAKVEPRSGGLDLDASSVSGRVRLSSDADHLSAPPPAKRSRSTGLMPRSAPTAAAMADDDDIQEVVPVKAEPTGGGGGGGGGHHVAGGAATAAASAVGTMAMYDDGSEDQLGVAEGGGYDDTAYQEDEEYGEYGDAEQYNMSGGAQDAASGRDFCPYCQKAMLRGNIQKHIRVKHSVEEPATCPQCSKRFKSTYYMKEHLRKQHGIAQRQTTAY